MKTINDIIFCFDTEDFTCNESADAIRDLANILKDEGIRGNFCVVGLLAEQLTNWKRDDVFEALSHHEIQLHSYAHTLHPMINEYTDTENFSTAYDRFITEESKGLELLKKHLHTEKVYAAVPPGNSKSYVALYGYADMGIPAYCDTVIDSPDGGLYFCNALHMQYMISLESVFYYNSKTFDELIEWFGKRKRTIIYTHPNRVLFKEFWDEKNYFKKNRHPFGEWEMCEKESSENIERYYSGLKALIRRLKSEGYFRFKTISDIVKEENSKPERVVKHSDITSIYERLLQNFSYINSPCSLSISDIFKAAVHFINSKDDFYPGKVYGFLYPPNGVKEAVTLNAEDIRNAVKAYDFSGFLPHEISVGNTIIGPADFLFAMLKMLSCTEATIHIEPRDNLPCLDSQPKLRDIHFKGTWMHSDDFQDDYLSDRLRLQSWTMRPV